MSCRGEGLILLNLHSNMDRLKQEYVVKNLEMRVKFTFQYG